MKEMVDILRNKVDIFGYFKYNFQHFQFHLNFITNIFKIHLAIKDLKRFTRNTMLRHQ